MFLAAGTALARVLQSELAKRRTEVMCCGRPFNLLNAVVHWAVVLQEPSGLLAPMLKPFQYAEVKGKEDAASAASAVPKRMMEEE